MSNRSNRDAMPPIVPDLIPVTSWGSSLANLLTWWSWETIRAPVMARCGNRCQICAARPEAGLECHEIWAYSLPPAGARQEVVGVQRLIGLAALCPLCHEMFHLGFAGLRGRGARAKARLMALNRWHDADFEAYRAAMVCRYESRSQWRWILDLSFVQWAIPLIVDPAKGWTLAEDGSLSRPDPRTGVTAWTVILGVPYAIGGRAMPPLDPAEGYDGLLPEAGDFGFVHSMGNGAPDAVPDAVGQDDDEDPATGLTLRVVEVVDAEHARHLVAELMDRPVTSLADAPTLPASIPPRRTGFRAMLDRLLG